MKQDRLLQQSLAALLICAGVASCSQEEPADDNSLPEGKYPVVIQASGLQAVATPASSRATVDGDWQGVNTVAVEVDGTVKEYTATASAGDGYQTATLSGTDPFYWQNTTETKSVTAWWPYSDVYPAYWTVKADQGKADNFYASDLIRGELTGLTFADRNRPMTFFHQTAKVSVQLIADDGVTFDSNTSVRLLNVSYVKNDEGNDVTTINTYQPDDAAYTYLALLAPQTISGGSRFIQVTVGGDNFYYTPTDAKPLEAGTAYTYTITVKADGSGIEVKEVMDGKWTDGGSEAVTGKNVQAKYTAADVKKGDYIYTDGTTSDGGLRTIYTDGSMVSLSGADKPQPVTGKTVAGIVFWTPSETSTGGRTTPASLTDDKIMAADYPDCTRGLAVSLKEFSSLMAWQSSSESVATYFQSSYYFTHPNKNNFVSIASGVGNTDNINRILGYQNTQVLLYYNVHCNGNSKPNYIAKPVAALAEFGENTNPAPTGSTGWFFPSAKELHILCYKDVDNVYWGNGTDTRDIVNTSLSAASGDNLTDSKYWSSSEYANDSNCAFSIQFYNASVEAYGLSKSYQYKVRAVCAF